VQKAHPPAKSAGRVGQPRFGNSNEVITTKSDEVETVLVLVADRFDVHSCGLETVQRAHPPAKSAGRVGQPRIGKSARKFGTNPEVGFCAQARPRP